MLVLIENHRLWGPAQRYVAAHKREFPESFVVRLEGVYRQKALCGIQQLGVLFNLVQALESQGVFYIALKGPFLSTLLYGDPNLRFSHDLDIYVGYEGLARTDAILRGLGCEPVDSPAVLKHMGYGVLHNHHVKYLNRRFHVTVEVHVRIASDIRTPEITVGNRDEITTLVELNGKKIRVFKNDFLLPYLCHHGTVHCWRRIFWLADISILARKLGPEGQERSLELARQYDARKEYATAMQLTQLLAKRNTPLHLEGHPVFISRQIRDYWNASVIKESPESFHPCLSTAFRLFLWRMYFSANTRDRIFQILQTFFQPNTEDVKRIDLPRRLAWAYLLLRPCRLVGHFLLSPIRRIGGKRPEADAAK